MNASNRSYQGEDQPNYTYHAGPTPHAPVKHGYGRRSAPPSQNGRAQNYWCNICNAVCETNGALRGHYQTAHPNEWARTEQLTAKLGQADNARDVADIEKR